MNKWKTGIATLLLGLIVSGCGSQASIQKPSAPSPSQLTYVETQVRAYQSENGVLPLLNKEVDTDRFAKYPVNFKAIVPRYLDEIPANSFEAGGIFQYVIIDVDKSPTVRALDVRTAQQLGSAQLRIRTYMSEEQYPPFGEQLSPTFWTIDLKKLNLKQPLTVDSPFQSEPLRVIMDTKGVLYVDYSPVVDRFVRDRNIESDADPLLSIAKEGPFVPAFGAPLEVNEGRIDLLK
ncbi:MAG: hypothetical protein ACRC5C_15440 [Bacilli bacterium]